MEVIFNLKMANDPAISAYESLGADINKRKVDTTLDTKEGIVSDKLPELSLAMPDEDILKLTKKWKKVWEESNAKAEWEKQIEENEKYWLGKHFDQPKADKTRPSVDNLIFESLETYLPQVTRRNPEPSVTLDASEKESPIFDQYISGLKNRLGDLADKNKVRLKLKKAARHWAIYQLGVAKFGWDIDQDIPAMKIIRPKKVILDPDATIDEDGYTGNHIGEYRKLEASNVLSIIGKENAEAKKAIDDKLSKDELGTEIQFIEWWTPQYVCWEFDKKIIYKRQNPHWNYDKDEDQTQVDEFGTETKSTQNVPGINHFKSPQMPYIFLSVFNLGDQPMDKTSLINQNLANQDLINKRNKQIDKNATNINGGWIVSLARAGLTKPQAEGVVKAMQKGGAAVIPDGVPTDAINKINGTSLPSDIFNQLYDARARLRDIFGVKGSAQAGLESERTVRGKILSRSLDTDRIGGGVSEYLEQFADAAYNWLTQLLYVYDSDFQFSDGGLPPKVVISVKEGSLLPKDSMTIANQAIELAGMNRISTLDLFKRLEYPNPEELAANVWLEVNAPHLLYKNNPLIQEAMMGQQQAAMMKTQNESEQKSQESSQSHQQNLQTEALKIIGKQAGEGGKAAGGSILSAVPQNLAVQ